MKPLSGTRALPNGAMALVVVYPLVRAQWAVHRNVQYESSRQEAGRGGDRHGSDALVSGTITWRVERESRGTLAYPQKVRGARQRTDALLLPLLAVPAYDIPRVADSLDAMHAADLPGRIDGKVLGDGVGREVGSAIGGALGALGGRNEERTFVGGSPALNHSRCARTCNWRVSAAGMPPAQILATTRGAA